MSIRTVMCYGDSNTHGTMPMETREDLGRFGPEARWPGVMAAALGPGWRVIEEGLPGRTTVLPDPIGGAHQNGLAVLPAALGSHRPLDLVILMLGTNDMKPVIAGTAHAARAGIQRLVALIRHHEWSFDYDAPDVLIVSPPPLCETGDPIFSAMFQGGIEQSSMLASLYRDLADELGCGFFDAGSVAKTSPLDGVHLTAEDTRAIGRGLEPIVRMMLGI